MQTMATSPLDARQLTTERRKSAWFKAATFQAMVFSAVALLPTVASAQTAENGAKPARGVVADGMAAADHATAKTAAPPAVDVDPNQHEDGCPIHGYEVHVRVWHAYAKVANTAIAAAIGEIARISAKLSPDVRTSEVATINRAASKEEVIVSSETFRLLSNSLDLCRMTAGAFDPTVASFDYLWNFRRRPAVRPLDD